MKRTKSPEIYSCCSQSFQYSRRTVSFGQYPRVSSFVEAKLIILNKHQTSATIVQTLHKREVNQTNYSMGLIKDRLSSMLTENTDNAEKFIQPSNKYSPDMLGNFHFYPLRELQMEFAKSVQVAQTRQHV